MAKKSRKKRKKPTKRLVIPVVIATIKLMLALIVYGFVAFWIFLILLDILSNAMLGILTFLLIFLGPGMVIYHFIKKFSRFS